ncbi:hypothetical protein LAJLEIBI_01173 [[Clostridium] hylemonae DSM 15053]|nr:hypothetical protein LAJLEIBI_01173 [[Clostridium] hylemonae DSM 15053]
MCVLFSTIYINVVGKHYVKQKYNIVFIIVIVVVLLLTSFLFVIDRYDRNPYMMHHFNAYFYPVYRVYSGQTLTVDFHNMYGFYPYLLLPIALIFGGGKLTEYGFSLTMMLLVFIVFGCLAYVIWKSIRFKFLAVVSTLAVIFVACLMELSNKGSYYLQYCPHRMLFPCVIILFIYKCIQNDCSNKSWLLGGYWIAAISIFFNLDTGVIVAIVWLLFRCYWNLLDKISIKQFLLKSLKQFSLIILCSVAIFMLISFITYYRTGSWIRLSEFFLTQTVFYKYGFYMIKMSLWHPWLILVAIYMVSLSKSIKNIYWLSKKQMGKEQKIISQLYFVLPVMGMGIFSYYQGRSHNEVFSWIVWPAVIIIALFTQDKLLYYKEKGKLSGSNNAKLYIGLIGLLFLSFDTIGILVFPKVLSPLKSSKIEETYIDVSAEFIQKFWPEQKVDLILSDNVQVAVQLGMPLDTPFTEYIDWYTKEDYNEIIDYLKQTRNLVAFDNVTLSALRLYKSEEMKEIESDYLHLEEIEDAGGTEIFYMYRPNIER